MQYRKLTKNTNISGKRVIVRIAGDVPIHQGIVRGDGVFRLERLLPTLTFLRQKKAKSILITHLGSPKGKTVSGLSVRPVAKKLGSILQQNIRFIPATVGSEAEKAVERMKAGDCILLENLRFHPEEEQNRASYAKKIAAFGDVYINEAFSVSHRKHASIASLPLHLPGYAGFQFQEEVRRLYAVKTQPKKPLGVIIGGAKITSKLGVITGLASKAHAIFLGGDVANALIDPTRFKRLSRDEQRAVVAVRRIAASSPALHLPEDVIVRRGARTLAIPTSQLTAKDTIIDVGPVSLQRMLTVLASTHTIIWSGPLGIFERPDGRKASATVARYMARRRATTIVGGGETTELILKLKLLKQFSFISTGGGAMLAFLAGDDLPGLIALRN